MAYGFLKREAEKGYGVEVYLAENMIFEAFIVVIRESDLPSPKIFNEIVREAYLKYSRLTEDEYTSLMDEFVAYHSGENYRD